MNKRTKIYNDVNRENVAIATHLPLKWYSCNKANTTERRKKIKIRDCNRKYYKILHAPTEAKKSYYTSKHAKCNTIKTSNQTRHRKKIKIKLVPIAYRFCNQSAFAGVNAISGEFV